MTTTKPLQKYTCRACGVGFMALPDHGKPRKFCSRACFCANAPKPTEKNCRHCGSSFLASRSSTANSEDRLRVFCSAQCARDFLRKQPKDCERCGTAFLPLNDDQRFCCQECRNASYVGEVTHNYKGGKYTDSQGVPRVLASRPGYVGKYMGEHQLAASKYIGRLVRRGEVVLHINRQKNDNRPENLFLCESMSMYARVRNGSLPWPKTSNLDQYIEAHNKGRIE